MPNSRIEAGNSVSMLSSAPTSHNCPNFNSISAFIHRDTYVAPTFFYDLYSIYSPQPSELVSSGSLWLDSASIYFLSVSISTLIYDLYLICIYASNLPLPHSLIPVAALFSRRASSLSNNPVLSLLTHSIKIDNYANYLILLEDSVVVARWLCWQHDISHTPVHNKQKAYTPPCKSYASTSEAEAL